MRGLLVTLSACEMTALVVAKVTVVRGPYASTVCRLAVIGSRRCFMVIRKLIQADRLFNRVDKRNMNARALKDQETAHRVPPVPLNEAERLSTLLEVGILDTPPDAAFDRLTRLAASMFGTRYAFLSFVDADRQWFKSAQGIEAPETPRSQAFCAYTILNRDAMVVYDALEDERFRDNPLVQGKLYLRFYMGVPVTSAEGHNIGTFCIADTRPRFEVSDEDKLSLATLAEMASEMTDEFRRNRELRASEGEARDRYALVARATLDGVWDWDIGNERVYYSPRWQRILGLGEIDCVATVEYWTERVHPEDQPGVVNAIQRQVEGETAPFRSEHRVQHGDGSWRWVVVRGLTQRDVTGKATRMAGSLMDVTQEKTSDALTRLPNRLILHERLTRLIQRSETTKSWQFAVFSVDIDDFKSINDQHGHGAGDKVLVAVAERAKALVAETRQRKESLVARLSGDEFVVVLDGVRNTGQAVAVAKRLQAAISAPIEIDGERVEARVSIGIALAAPQVKTPESFVHSAGLAMYQAKIAGSGAATVFDLSMQEENLRRLKTESMLRRAVGLGELRLFFQPQVDLATGAVIGCEALVRWQHPELGMVPPDYFIPLAEKAGIIGEVDGWVLEMAARQIAAWRAASPVALKWHMSVNISAEKFPSSDLLRNVQETLARHGLPPSVLCMEITETALVRHVAESAQAMHALRTIGVGLHMDDFGSGYSSFRQLYELPFDVLKIDRSFLKQIVGNEQAVNIVRGILSLAKTLGMSSIAEGIETAQQEALLRSLGCERGQGYFYSKPVDAETFTAKYLHGATA